MRAAPNGDAGKPLTVEENKTGAVAGRFPKRTTGLDPATLSLGIRSEPFDLVRSVVVCFALVAWILSERAPRRALVSACFGLLAASSRTKQPPNDRQLV
jgi:hypothetical protein